MQWLSRLEHLVESVIEGTFRTIFRASLQPVELAKVLERAMEEGLVVGPSATIAPNTYVVRLHPVDERRLALYRETLQRDLAQHLQAVARKRGWRVRGPIRVQVVAQSVVPPGRWEVDARLEDPAPRTLASSDEVEQTARLDLAAVAAASKGPPAVLRGPDGQVFQVAGPVVTLGRALENDIVLPDPRVSRYHAQIRNREGRHQRHLRRGRARDGAGAATRGRAVPRRMYPAVRSCR